jgi:hypothetical protein
LLTFLFIVWMISCIAPLLCPFCLMSLILSSFRNMENNYSSVF